MSDYFTCAHICKIEGGIDADNNLENIKKLIEADIDWIEMDVQVTTDGIPYLFHDNEFDQDTNSTGSASPITKSWSEVSKIKYKNGQPICRLSDALKALKDSKKTNVYFQLDKLIDSKLSKIADKDIFKGLESQMIGKTSDWSTPPNHKKFGIPHMTVLDKKYVKNVKDDKIVDEIASQVKANGTKYLELQFNSEDTKILDGTLSRKLNKLGCKIFAVAVAGNKNTNPGGGWDYKSKWEKLVNDVYVDGIMTNSPKALKKYLDGLKPKDGSEKKKKEEPTSGTQSTPTGMTPSTPEPTIAATPSTPPGVKITLKKTSGPGELIGVVEQESINSLATFEGLQFSEPGDYVISAIPASPDVGGITFSITIGKADEIIEQAPKGNTQSVEGNRPIIAQIDKPTYKLQPITFPIQTSDTGVAGVQINAEIATHQGFKPIISYNGSIIKEDQIKSLEIYYDGILPKCDAIFGDSLGQITAQEGKPQDDTPFDVFLTSNSKYLKPIHMKMKILSHDQNKRDNSISFSGTLDIPEFYKINGKSYDGTSFESLRTLVKEFKLGYNSNITNTEDKMVWKASNKMNRNFIEDIMEHSYISDDSFITGYIDYYYCFNYIDVEKEWKRDISKDIGVDATGIHAINPGEKENIKNIFLTNDYSVKESSMYFSKWELTNDSTSISTKAGQFIKSMVYDRLKKSFLVFDVDSLTSKGDDKVVLKGKQRDDKEHKTNFRTNFSGFIDTENTHPNYLYAKTQNKVNFNNLMRIKAELILPNVNFNLYRFQKIRIDFINQKQTVTDSALRDERLSGEWIIYDIRFTWASGVLLQKLNVCRKEYGKTSEEMKNQKTKKDNKENKENNKNANEDNKSPKPNDAYVEGEKYTITDESGLRYLITVEKKSEDGNEITAKITPLDGKGPFRISSETTSPESSISGTASNASTSGTASNVSTSGNTSGTASNAETSGQSSTPTEPEKDVYTIAVDLALSSNTNGFYTNVNGTITFEKIGNEYFAIGNLQDFGNGARVTSRSNAIVQLDSLASASNMMIRLEDKVTNNPELGLKGGQLILKIIGKKN